MAHSNSCSQLQRVTTGAKCCNDTSKSLPNFLTIHSFKDARLVTPVTRHMLLVQSMASTTTHHV